MESDPNPFPELRLFELPRAIRKLGHFLFDHIQSEGLSDHARHEQRELQTPKDIGQLALWDDMGNYYEGDIGLILAQQRHTKE